MSEPLYLIVNPTSGSHSGPAIKSAASILRANGYAVEIFTTRDSSDPTRCAREISAKNENPFIIVAGGDGTINGVLNGLSPGKATVAILPAGTANVLARELRIGSIKDSVDKILRGVTGNLSVGMIRHLDAAQYFFMMAGVGFDGDVVHGVRLAQKKYLGKLAYVLSACRVLSKWDRDSITVQIGEDREEICHSVILCNGSRYAGDFVLAPQASIFEPGFTVICLKSSKRGSYFNIAFNLFFGKLPAGGNVSIFQTDHAVVSGDKCVQVDGDYWCSGPVTIDSFSNYAKIIV